MSTLPPDFWTKVEKTDGGCWIWTSVRDGGGYGRYYMKGTKRSRSTHRLAYQDAKGPIPEGFQIDHLCRNRACVNPEHLQPVTAMVNVRRGMMGPKPGECRWGHVMDDENTYVDGRGMKRCRKCNVMNVLRNRAKKGDGVLCPFCGEPIHSLESLKTHLSHDCEVYPQTEATPWMPHNDEVSRAT